VSTTTPTHHPDLTAAYFRHVDADDLQGRSPDDLAATVSEHLALAELRPEGRAEVQVGASGGRGVVAVVVEDMPYLVDSVTAALRREGYDVHLVVHPVFDVTRDVTGRLQQVHAVPDASNPPRPEDVRESWMHLETDPVADVEALEAELHRVLSDVRAAVEDEPKLRAVIEDLSSTLRRTPPAGIDGEQAAEAAALLDWMADDHFTFLGFREYHLERAGDADVLRAVPGTGLGILRADPAEPTPLAGIVAEKAREQVLLVMAKANSRSTVRQPAYLDYVGVKVFDESGQVTGERRLLGLFTPRAASEAITRIPLVRGTVDEVLHRSGFDPRSHAGKALLETLEAYPRDDLFRASAEDLMGLVPIAVAARRGLRVYVRPDTYGRYVSVLVSLPRDRYSTAVRERFAQLLAEMLGGTDVEFTVRIAESTTALVHFVVHVPEVTGLDVHDLERALAAASRSWRDDLATALAASRGEEGLRRAAPLLDAFPESYKDDVAASVAAGDVDRLLALREHGEDGLDLALYEEPGAPVTEARLKLYRVGPALSLSKVLPMLASLGVEVIDERPYELSGLDVQTFVYDVGLRYGGPLADRPQAAAHAAFCETLLAMWDGRAEVDGFNCLVLAAGLDHRQVTVLRAYAKYLHQAGTPFGQATIEAALVAHPEITRLIVELFAVRFDPDLVPNADGDRGVREGELVAAVEHALDEVASLDEDRIIRTYLAHVRATLRTSHYLGTDTLALKLDPQQLPDLPRPRPAYEIFVYSPVVEGVHLRFGKVARGGLRWSDRRDDFRTEVLGLVKAQMVKNTVIVPVGAKGGFVPKGVDGPTAYRIFISGLLDLTDNLVAGDSGEQRVVPPARIVRHDGDDPYLVVAADKGTATFSDLANAIAVEHGFWLGDAFASGGSVGYDHKAMGITAKGAWVSVRRHFRELGVDCQREEFRAVGIGDMSGDVFGNGMLLSPHLRLVAAFDHRDIFLDPTPEAASSFAERTRLFALPRSSWQDYDRSLISEGGGIYSRTLKSIAVTPQVREALGLDDAVVALTPAQLISAILRAPVDLLWNGGIGTYVKGASEPHSAAGDKANDAVRVNGGELRARLVGEGGNLGFTQAGRVEYALAGGRINTDAIDNSAGVDTSDHEVNLKILLDRLVAAGELTGQERNELLGSMADDVERLVLHDNEEQNVALANAAANAVSLLPVFEDWMSQLVSRGVLDREIEGLPSTTEVRRRIDVGLGLTAPEHAVLMSWTKIELARELLETDLPEDPYLETDLSAYFPDAVRGRFREAVEAHSLRREIIVTEVVNDLVNGAGTSFWPRLAGETGANAADLTRANFVAREIFGSLPLRNEIKGLDFVVDAAVQTRMRLEMRTLVERASRWLITHRLPGEEGSTAIVERFQKPVQHAMAQFPDLLSGQEADDFAARCASLTEAGVPEDLATRVAVLAPSYMLLGVVEVALRSGRDPLDVARVHVEVGERLGLPRMLGRIVALPRSDKWQSMARAAIREDLHTVHTDLTARALEDPTWGDSPQVAGVAATLADLSTEEADLARLSVALRVLRGLLM